MDITSIKPHKIMKPIQLVALWFSTLLLLDLILLNFSAKENIVEWMRILSFIAALIIIPIFVFIAYRLQTKFRPYLGEDKYFYPWLKDDTPSDFQDTEVIGKNLIEIKFGLESDQFRFNDLSESPVLKILGRINYSHPAGAAHLLRVKVNGKYLKEHHLINKPLEREYITGRRALWYNKQYRSWSLCYSPDFKANYFHKLYRVINGDPYEFKFDLSEFLGESERSCAVIFEHVGLENNEAYKNSLVLTKPEIY
jgi:hypothetical protein